MNEFIPGNQAPVEVACVLHEESVAYPRLIRFRCRPQLHWHACQQQVYCRERLVAPKSLLFQGKSLRFLSKNLHFIM